MTQVLLVIPDLGLISIDQIKQSDWRQKGNIKQSSDGGWTLCSDLELELEEIGIGGTIRIAESAFSFIFPCELSLPTSSSLD